MTNLAGLHDIESVAIAPLDTWVLDTISLSDKPAPRDYNQAAPGRNVIVRVNWGYGSTGTLPVPAQYLDFARRAYTYVEASKGCSRWVIGNEPNLSREWPDGRPIFPHLYAACYKLTRDAIHSLPGHERDEVLIAASGPWNAELKYSGNPNGDWIQYFAHVLDIVGGDCDGFSLHAYTHGYNVALVNSSARMQPPFQSRHYEFRTYRDYMEAIPDALSHLPVYLTEANGNGPWQAVGLMPAMLGEIDAWNNAVGQPIRSVIFYRYPKYDDFYIEGKADVIDEYKAAVGRGYSSPQVTGDKVQDKIFIPDVSPGTVPAEPPPDRNIDPRATARGVKVETPTASPLTWRAVKVEWLDEQQSQGRHHIYADVLDEQGKRLAGVPLLVTWPSGESRITTEAKPGDPYAANLPMSPSRNEFSIKVDGLALSETVKGIGMGADTPGGFNSAVHTSTGVVFQRATTQPQKPPPIVGTGPQPPPAKPTSTTAYVAVKAGANLRLSPVTGDILTAIPYGSAVQVLHFDSASKWFQVRYGGITGWIRADLLSDTPPDKLVEREFDPTEDHRLEAEDKRDKWQRTIAFILKEEGGYTANDEGAPANFGINQGANPDLDVAHITREQAIERYRTKYWMGSGADKLDFPFCLLVMDAAVQHGEGVAREMLKQSGGNSWRFQGLRQDFYGNIEQGKWQRNGRAWMKRMGRLLVEAST